MPTFDRRSVLRYNVRVPLLIRLWKSAAPLRRSQATNLSRHGVCFVTDLPLQEGSVVQLLLEMPSEIAGKSMDLNYVGHVVRVQGTRFQGGPSSVGVRFDCYGLPPSIEPS